MGSDFFIRKTFEYTLKDLLFARRENFGRTLILILINRSGHESHNFFVHPSFAAYNHANRPCQTGGGGLFSEKPPSTQIDNNRGFVCVQSRAEQPRFFLQEAATSATRKIGG